MQTLTVLLVLVSPALLCWVWSRLTGQVRVKVLLRRTALIIIGAVAILFAVTLVVDSLCGGSQLKGFAGCRIIPDWLANASILSVWLIPIVGLWTLGVMIYCGNLESRARRGAKGQP